MREQGRERDTVTTEREPDTEAGGYIEDDPIAWLAFVEAVREYASQFDAITKHLGTPDAAAEVVGIVVALVLGRPAQRVRQV